MGQAGKAEGRKSLAARQPSSDARGDKPHNEGVHASKAGDQTISDRPSSFKGRWRWGLL